MSPTIWMLENDHDDRYITQSTFNELGIDVPLTFFSYSHDLLTALKTERPSIILISFSAVPLNGIEVLEAVKADKNLNDIPVIILSENSTPDTISKCYRAGANSYIVKPSSPALIQQKIKAFFDYWFTVAELG